MAKKQERRKRQRASARKRAEAQGAKTVDYLKLPPGVELWRPEKPGVVTMDIWPYEVGEGNPYADPGFAYYEYTFYTYKSIGPNNDTVIAIGKTLKQRDAVATWFAAKNAEPNVVWKDIKDFRPKMRQMFNVSIDGSEPGKFIFEFSNWGFGELLNERIKEPSKQKRGDFWDIEGGMTLTVNFKEESVGDGKALKAVSIDFEPRDDIDEEEILAKTHCLEKCINPLSSAALEKLFLQIEDDDSEPHEPAAESVVDDDDDDDDDDQQEQDDEDDDEPTAESLGIVKGGWVNHKEFGKCEVLKVSADGTSLTLEDSDGDVHKAVAPADCKPIKAKAKAAEPDEDDEPSPKKSGKSAAASSTKSGKSAAKTSGSDDDSDDDVWDDEPAKPAAKAVNGKEKPVKKEQPKKETAKAAVKDDDDDDEDWGDDDDN